MANSRRSTVFRVTGLPLDKAELDTKSKLLDTIHDLLTEDKQQSIEVDIDCIPSCDGEQTSSALVDFKGGNPEFLSHLDRDPLSDWQIEMGDDDINFDRHFFGFTQLYPTAPEVTADIIAITGLDGHAYGSWRGKGNLGRMWLRDFLSKDLPNCRTMIYGYNSKLTSHGVDTIMDYGREFLEGIKRVRHTQELRERPLFFIAHSFGGIILAHCLVKAVQTDERDEATIAALYKATYGILFFGTPHKGLVIDDIQRMIAGEDHHPRTELIEQIKVKSDLLIYQLIDFKNLIRDRKIISFYERQQTRRLELNAETGDWGRTGSFMTAVDSGSALLDLPDSVEAKIPVNADHSQIVKFDSRNADIYQTATGYLKRFEQDARKVVSDRFSPARRIKPPTSTVPFERDKMFVGRQDIIEALESHFSQADSHNRVVLVGLGGVGKSQIAIEWSYRLRAKDPQMWIFWVHAATADRFEHSYKSIAATLELPGWNDPKLDVLGLVSRWLSNIDNGRWLMILDNTDDIDMLRRKQWQRSQDTNSTQNIAPLSSYIPQTTTGSVLFTTRDRKAASCLSTGYTSIITVDLMKPGDAQLLLRSKIPEGISIDSERTELVKELDYLPLAITQAAAYISARATRMSVSRYLALYQQDKRNQSRLLDEDSGDLRRDAGVSNSVIRTWQISFDQIKRSQPRAAELLSFIAMIDRQGIPEFLLSFEFPDPLDLEEALAPLFEFSLILIEKGGKTFEMHRLVQLATRLWLEKYKEVEKWQVEAINVLSRAFPTGDFTNWETCEALSPHAREALRCGFISEQSLLMRGSLLYHMAWYNWVQGRFVVALEESQKSLAIQQQCLVDDNRSLLNNTSLVASVLNSQGKYAESETMTRQTLLLKEEVFGKTHPSTLMTISNLALVLDSQGKYAEAETINRQTLLLKEEVFGKTHPETLMTMSNLALVLGSQGKYAEAETMNRQTLLLKEEVFGKTHPSTLTTISNLAGVLGSQGKYAEAETMTRQTLLLKEEVLGKTHPSTLMTISNLALVLGSQGKYAEAETMNRQTLLLKEEVLGKTHPSTLMTISNLALVLGSQGKYAEAETMTRQMLLLKEEVLGKTHPETLTTISNLALVLGSQGKYAEAETMNRRALTGLEMALGPEHPDTLTSVYCLAHLLQNLVRRNEAIVLYNRAWNGLQKTLGLDHPTTRACSDHRTALIEEVELQSIKE